MDFTDMTDEQLYTLIEAAQTELGKRQTRDVFDQKLAEVVQEGRTSGIIETPEPGEQWKQPSGAHNAYAKGDIVEHDGQQWVSTVTPNVWEPGVSGWHHAPLPDPETGEPVIPDYVQPTGAHDVYNTGDQVRFEGQVYESLIDGNNWTPTDYPAGWQLIEPDTDDAPEDETDPDALPEWEIGKNYETGDVLIYQGVPFKVLQSHTSAENWLPDQVPALYERGTIVDND